MRRTNWLVCGLLFVVGCGGGAQSNAERLCSVLGDAINMCSAATDCDKALDHDCSSITGLLNDAFLGATADCINAGGDPTICLKETLGKITPTAAQESFAASFCQNCALGTPGCKDAFFSGRMVPAHSEG